MNQSGCGVRVLKGSYFDRHRLALHPKYNTLYPKYLVRDRALFHDICVSPQWQIFVIPVLVAETHLGSWPCQFLFLKFWSDFRIDSSSLRFYTEGGGTWHIGVSVAIELEKIGREGD